MRSAKTANGTVLLDYDEDGKISGDTQKDASGTTFAQAAVTSDELGETTNVQIAAGPLAHTEARGVR
jgi:hypothetical protein